MSLADELRHNLSAFQDDLRNELVARLDDLAKHRQVFEESYIKISSLQAWRTYITEPHLNASSNQFFVEAQNDALISHVQACLGSWRVALKSLRSCIENSLLCLYFKDHPVELKQWESGKFRIGFSAVLKYMKDHPAFYGLPETITGIGIIEQQYGKLSQAVHASSADFRMTEDGKGISLWRADEAHQGRWKSHEKQTILGLNLILLVIFRHLLQGASLTPMRKSLGLVIPKSKDTEIKKHFAVTISR